MKHLKRGKKYLLKYFGLCEYRGLIKARNAYAFEDSKNEYHYIKADALRYMLNHWQI